MKTGLRMVRQSRVVNAGNGGFFSARFSSDSIPQQPLDSVTVDPSASTTKTNDNVSKNSTSSLKHPELAKFFAIADSWKYPYRAKPFKGLNIADVGCGGGILSEPLAQMGATVTGIDAVEKNIKIASLHAVRTFLSTKGLDPETSTIEYCCTTAEKLVEEQRKFDAVIALEIIEHVADPAEFCQSLAALTVEGGATLISTINRSMRAYATAIVAAEYILCWLPKGTHEWSSFLTPEELFLILQRASIDVKEMAGFVCNPLTGRWSLSDYMSVNFIAFGSKNTTH